MALETLGKYELMGVLGRGAAGTVYDARDPVIGRRVAIKTVKLPNADDDETKEELERFRREARAAGGLSHPNIVPIYDYGETSEIAYIVMEYVGGGSLSGLLKKHTKLPKAEALRIMEQLLSGLQYSHERGIVHRDVKPDNVMLTDDQTVKIADFGIARIEGSGATVVGTMLGTPSYMSPEQWRGDAHIDARSDIYAAGVMLYHILTGKRPFEGNQSAIMHKVLSEDARPPSLVDPAAPPELDAVILKAMAKLREDRFASSAEFAAALKAAASGAPMMTAEEGTIVQSSRRPAPAAAPRPQPAAAAPKPAPAAEKPPAKSMGMVIAAAVAAVVVVGGGVTGWLVFGGKPEEKVAVTTPVQQQPVQPPVQQPVQPPVQAPVQQPVQQPVQAPVQQPVQPPVQPPVQQPVQPPVQAPVQQPVQPPVQQPVQQPIPTPPPPAVPTPREVLAGIPCAAVYGDASTARVALRGIVPQENFAALRFSYDHASAPVRTWDVLPFPALGIYCQVIDVLRPSLRTIGETKGVMARLIPSPNTHTLQLLDNDPIDFEVDAPDFASNLQVDYIGSDGKISHYMPRRAGQVFPARALRPGQHVRLFDTVSNGGFTVGPPFGTDLVVFIASSEPLQVPRASDDDDTVASYVANLRPVLESARRRNVRISVDIVPVESIEMAP